MNPIRRWLTVLALVLLPAICPAQTLTGSEDPAFAAAVSTWLAGENDLAALTELARLAREGNTAAQVLLAQIASRSNMHTHVTAGLPRKERIALLRQPGGLSGKSWLTEAEKTEPLAAALLQANQMGEKAPAIAALVARGEISAALLAAHSMVLQGEGARLVAALDGLEDRLPPEAVPLLHGAHLQAAGSGSGRYVGSARVPPPTPSLTETRAAELAWSGPSPRDIIENDGLRAVVMKSYPHVRSWTPVAQFCATHCPGSTPACVAAGVSALWATGAFALRSPLQSVLPDEAYWSSPRISGDLPRLVPDVRKWDADAEFRAVDACYFDAMATAQDKHGHAP